MHLDPDGGEFETGQIDQMRMALAGANPGPRDQREFARMGSEKLEAMTEAWQSMSGHLLQAGPAAAMAAWQSGLAAWQRSFWSVPSAGTASPQATWTRAPQAMSATATRASVPSARRQSANTGVSRATASVRSPARWRARISTLLA